MPKWKKTKKTENKGILNLKEIVNENGCIYRDVPGDTDTGIDGFIEFVNNEDVTGQLVAVQVKTGISYFNVTKNEFQLYVDDDILNYWKNYMLPVILYFYLPSKKLSVWLPIKEYIKQEEYHGRVPITKIKAPIHRVLDSTNFSVISEYARMNYDYKFSLEWLDNCLIGDDKDIISNFIILSNHPYSRDKLVTLFIARHLLNSQNEKLLKEIIWYLGYGAGRQRWSWNPGNKEEGKVIEYASKLCSELSKEELYKMLCLIDDEDFHGPTALGERYFDIICCSTDISLPMLFEVACNKLEPIQRRANALYLYFETDDDLMEDEYNLKKFDNMLADVFEYIFIMR